MSDNTSIGIFLLSFRKPEQFQDSIEFCGDRKEIDVWRKDEEEVVEVVSYISFFESG
jgi:hypothetical protein